MIFFTRMDYSIEYMHTATQGTRAWARPHSSFMFINMMPFSHVRYLLYTVLTWATAIFPPALASLGWLPLPAGALSDSLGEE